MGIDGDIDNVVGHVSGDSVKDVVSPPSSPVQTSGHSGVQSLAKLLDSSVSSPGLQPGSYPHPAAAAAGQINGGHTQQQGLNQTNNLQDHLQQQKVSSLSIVSLDAHLVPHFSRYQNLCPH